MSVKAHVCRIHDGIMVYIEQQGYLLMFNNNIRMVYLGFYLLVVL